MNPKMDPTNTGKPASQPPAVQQPNVPVERPKNLPGFLNSLIKPDTIGGDLCRYFVFPAIENGIHKCLGALLNYFVLGQKIAPSNTKSNGVYIYADNNGYVDYNAISTGKTQATIIDSNGVQYTYNNAKYTSATSAVFKIQNFNDDDVLRVNPIPWSWPDVETKQELMNDQLSEIIYQSQWASVQDVCDAAGIPGAPPTANKWGWKDISKMSVYIDPDDSTCLIINMGMPPKQIT